MKHTLHLGKNTAILILVLCLNSCGGKYDGKGRLLVESLTSTGSMNFSPMKHSDSASVLNFKPDTFLLKGKPFTGAIAQYNAQEKIMMEGFLRNGLMDSSWKFYYATGGVHISGRYNNGFETGLWRSYYGYDKPKIDKLYSENGFMLMRAEYYDNGHIKNYENIKHPLFDDKERKIEMGPHGDVISMYIEDSVLMLKQGGKAERIGKNVFADHKPSEIAVPSGKKP